MLEMKYYNYEETKAIGIVNVEGLLEPCGGDNDSIHKKLMDLTLHHFNAYERMAAYLKEWDKNYLLPYRIPENIITELLALADILPEPLKVGDVVKVIDVPLGAKVEIISLAENDEDEIGPWIISALYPRFGVLNSNTLCKILELPKP